MNEKPMLKMIIKMNEDKISNSDNYFVDKIYSKLDNILLCRGMTRFDTDRGIEYQGHNKNTDFAAFGKIMLALKNKSGLSITLMNGSSAVMMTHITKMSITRKICWLTII